VIGVVSGAGSYSPGLILDRRTSDRARAPIALIGKVSCKVDTTNGPVTVGDLLTTSGTAGFAMKATDPLKSFGSVIGKALDSLERGRALVSILVSLR
jgi:hypothetical protein